MLILICLILITGTDGNNCLITQTSDCERTPLRRRRTLNKYGGDSEPPKDDGIFYVNDDNYGCCAVVSISVLLKSNFFNVNCNCFYSNNK